MIPFPSRSLMFAILLDRINDAKKSAVEKLIPSIERSNRYKTRLVNDRPSCRNVSRGEEERAQACEIQTWKQIDKSEERGRATWPRSDCVAFSLVFSPTCWRLVRIRRRIRREEAVCRRLSARDVTQGWRVCTHQNLHEFCHWLWANVTHRAQERPVQFTRISFVQFGSIIDNASIPREEAIVYRTREGKSRSCPRSCVCGSVLENRGRALERRKRNKGFKKGRWSIISSIDYHGHS